MNIEAEKVKASQIFGKAWPKIVRAKEKGKREHVVYRLKGDEYAPEFWRPTLNINRINSVKVLELYNLIVEAGETPGFMLTEEDMRLECDLVVVFEK